MCPRAVGLPDPWLRLWVVLHLKMLLLPWVTSKMLWKRICQCEPPSGEGPWVWRSFRNDVSPHRGVHRPSCLKPHVGIHLGSPASSTFHGGEPPCQRELLCPRCPELLSRAGHAAGRLIKALCWSKGSCSRRFPWRGMAAGINAASPPAAPARRRGGRCAARLGVLN